MPYLNKKMALWKPPNNPNVEVERLNVKKKVTEKTTFRLKNPLDRIYIYYNEFMKCFLVANLGMPH